LLALELALCAIISAIQLAIRACTAVCTQALFMAGGREAPMEAIHGALLGVLVLWGAVTAVLIALLAYRGTLEIREDDQIFLDRAGDSMANEQRELVARIDKLSKPIKLFMILSIVLLLTALGVFLFEGFNKF
jgi:hypothetical protein